MLGSKRRGKRFRSVSAEIAVRSLGDPLIELLTFFLSRPQLDKVGRWKKVRAAG